jgi:CBS domain-containing protein
MPENPLVREIMSSPVETIDPGAPVGDAADAMHGAGVHALLVTTSPPSLITSTDILAAVAKRRELATLAVSDLLTESVETVPPTIRAGEAAAMMTSLGIGYLPVVDSGDCVGVVSSADLPERFA